MSDTGTQGDTTFEGALVRAADEGVPISALKRIFQPKNIDLRAILRAAVVSGRLVSMPAEDWPLASIRDQRAPTVIQHVLGVDDRDIDMKMARALRTTKQESCVLLVLLRRGHASREQLHDAIEANRGNPDEATNEKIVDVVVCKLRKKVKLALGVERDVIRTVHSRGYEITEADRHLAWAVINGEQPCQQDRSATTPGS